MTDEQKQQQQPGDAVPSPPLSEGDVIESNVKRLSPVILASVTLQSLLYYNIFYSVVCAVVLVPSFAVRAASLTASSNGGLPVAELFSCIAIGAWALCEPIRLVLGFSGNLLERVPQASAFVLVTAIPQLPLSVYFIVAFLRARQPPFPLGFAITVLQPAFLFPEFVVGIVQVRKLVSAQSQSFFQNWDASTSAPGQIAPGEEDAESEEPPPGIPNEGAWVELRKRNKAKDEPPTTAATKTT